MVRKVKSTESMEGAIGEMSRKQALRVSGGTVLRWKEPTSNRALFNTQFVHDYSQFQKLTPDIRKGVLIEASSGPKKSKTRSDDNRQSINPSCNRSQVFGSMKGVFLGSSSDQKGNY